MMSSYWMNQSASLLQQSNMTSEDSLAMTQLGYQFMEKTTLLRYLFYLVTPGESSYATVDEVPNYFLWYLPITPLVMLPEIIYLYLKGKRMPRFGDAMCSLCCVMLLFLPVAVLGKVELHLYIWFYEKFHIIELPWQSPLVWFLCLLATDLGLYVWHRASHEVNFIWAFHQIHHSSQDFNLTMSSRLPSFNRYVGIIFYLPIGFFFPPAVFYVHNQFNYLFQVWIHSDVIPGLGWGDYIINNPSLHRVHHGRNRYCIDKNYGAVFSFWDIIFGTFEREHKGEELYYGLVHNVDSYDPLYLQAHHFQHMFRTVREMKGFGNKLSVFLKGPGWAPNKPRLGIIEEIPVVPENKTLYDTFLPNWLKLYIVLHIVTAFTLFGKIAITRMVLPSFYVWLHAGYVLWTVACVGYFLEIKSYAPLLDGTRCAAYFLLEIILQDVLTADLYLNYFLRAVFLGSTLLWAVNIRILKPQFGKKMDSKRD